MSVDAGTWQHYERHVIQRLSLRSAKSVCKT